jgi:hypothetical protein
MQSKRVWIPGKLRLHVLKFDSLQPDRSFATHPRHVGLRTALLGILHTIVVLGDFSSQRKNIKNSGIYIWVTSVQTTRNIGASLIDGIGGSFKLRAGFQQLQ